MAKNSANAAPAKDPVVELWSEIRATDREQEEISALSHAHPNMSSEAHIHHYDRYLALKEVTSTVRATTLEGGAIHIYEAICRLDLIKCEFPEKKLDFRIAQDFRAAERMLWSALYLLLAASNTDLDLLSTLGCDPWETFKDKEAGVAEDGHAGKAVIA